MPKITRSLDSALYDDFPCQIRFNGYTYTSVEHALLCERYLDEQLTKILRKLSLKDTKYMVQKLWTSSKRNKFQLLWDLRVAKFTQNEDLRRILISSLELSEDLRYVKQEVEDIPFEQGDLFWNTL